MDLIFFSKNKKQYKHSHQKKEKNQQCLLHYTTTNFDTHSTKKH